MWVSHAGRLIDFQNTNNSIEMAHCTFKFNLLWFPQCSRLPSRSQSQLCLLFEITTHIPFSAGLILRSKPYSSPHYILYHPSLWSLLSINTVFRSVHRCDQDSSPQHGPGGEGVVSGSHPGQRHGWAVRGSGRDHHHQHHPK